MVIWSMYLICRQLAKTVIRSDQWRIALRGVYYDHCDNDWFKLLPYQSEATCFRRLIVSMPGKINLFIYI